MITRITTLPQLEALQNSTMIYAVITALVALLLAFLISLMIKYQGGLDKSYITLIPQHYYKIFFLST